MSKKILHVFSIPFSITYFVGEQFLYFNKKKQNAYFVSCSDGEELQGLSQRLGFRSIPVEINRSISPISDLKAVWGLSKIIKANKIDKVVGHSPKGALVAMMAAWLCGVPQRVYFRHGIFYETSSGMKRVLLKNIDKISGHLATHVVCVSRAVKQISEKDGISPEKKNIILGRGTCNGVDAMRRFNPKNQKTESASHKRAQLGIGETDIVIGFVGRLVKDKGIDDLVNAWRSLAQKHTGIKLLLVGPKEERDPISEETMSEILHNPTIISVGNVPDTENYYALMDIFILPTYREGFPTVILEASAMGLPIITTTATGCEEAIQKDITGIISSHRIEDLAEYMELLMHNSALRKHMGEAGRAFVEQNFEQTIIWDIIDEKLDL